MKEVVSCMFEEVEVDWSLEVGGGRGKILLINIKTPSQT